MKETIQQFTPLINIAITLLSLAWLYYNLPRRIKDAFIFAYTAFIITIKSNYFSITALHLKNGKLHRQRYYGNIHQNLSLMWLIEAAATDKDQSKTNAIILENIFERLYPELKPAQRKEVQEAIDKIIAKKEEDVKRTFEEIRKKKQAVSPDTTCTE